MSALPTLEGTRILVTGASSGIGAALAPMLAQSGATVAIAARRTDRLSAVLDACREASTGDRGGDGAGHRMWSV
ncbi:MAG: SDR family NAD(P)-dependent oxidoreductase, partial [Acidimicrobiales bacterium]